MTHDAFQGPAGNPLQRLFLAVNQYISTGDRLGEGIALNIGSGKVRILIPVNRALPTDVEDWECFRSRFQELEREFGLSLRRQGPPSAGLEMWTFDVKLSQVEPLANALVARPGVRGWGSPRTLTGSSR